MNHSNGNHNSSSNGDLTKTTKSAQDSSADSHGKLIKRNPNVSFVSSIGLDSTLTSTSETHSGSSLLHWLTDATLHWLKPWTWSWVVLLPDPPVLEKLKPLRILVELSDCLSSCSTVLIKWTKTPWLRFLWDCASLALGDVSMSSTESQSKCCLSSQPKSRPASMLKRKRKENSSSSKKENSVFKTLQVSLLPWTLVMLVELNCPITWKPCSDHAPWLFLIWSWFAKTCSCPKVSYWPKNCQRSSCHCTCFQDNSCQNNDITIGVWEQLSLCWDRLVSWKETQTMKKCKKIHC